MRRLRRPLLLLLTLAGLAGGAFAESDVIYPRSTVPAGASVASVAAAPGRATLVVGVACALAGGWLFWRHRRTAATGAGRNDRRLVIAETRPLGNRQHLVVADYDGRKFLLGVCPGRIDLLSPLDDGRPAGNP